MSNDGRAKTLSVAIRQIAHALELVAAEIEGPTAQPAPAAHEARLLAIMEVADRLGVSERTVRRQVRAGHLPHRRVGGRILIPASAVECLVTVPHDES